MGTCSSAPKPQAHSTPTELPNTTPNPIDVKGNTPKSFNAKYELKEKLGEGAYSVVNLGIAKATGAKVAVKIVNKASLKQEDEYGLRMEVHVMKKLSHPNIVKLYDFYETPTKYLLVMEYCGGGELFDLITKRQYFNEKDARDTITLVLLAIKYIHEQDVAHRDLKPENLLLTNKRNDSSLKIADFGFALPATGNNLSTRCGTPGYIAPEILEGVKYGKSVDMWSIGVILFILLGGYPPFEDDNQIKLFRKIKKGEFKFLPEYWGNVSEDAKDLIRKLLIIHPHKRYTADQALSHPWLKTADAVLESRDLNKNLAELKKFRALRKFRGAVHAVIAARRFKVGGAHHHVPVLDAPYNPPPVVASSGSAKRK